MKKVKEFIFQALVYFGVFAGIAILFGAAFVLFFVYQINWAFGRM